MRTAFQKAIIPTEIRSLVVFDHKVFHEHPSDWFDRDDWKAYESWWMIVESRKVGCCAFALHEDFQEDVREEQENTYLRGSLYVVTTGILQPFRGQGFGDLMKCWQISYARRHGYTRIVTNTRKSNKAMIGLNKKFGFGVLRTTSGYYGDPLEPTVVMERQL
jgi:ribosomal protein S18 acetylase RimI-like enzyme